MSIVKNQISFICVLISLSLLSCSSKEGYNPSGQTIGENNTKKANEQDDTKDKDQKNSLFLKDPDTSSKKNRIRSKLITTEVVKKCYDQLVNSNQLDISKIDENNPEHLEIIKLICVQKLEFERIKNELKDNGKKTSHWIWYIYFTQKPGSSDSNKVKVDLNYRSLYLEVLSDDIYNEWIGIIDTIHTGFDTDKNYLPSGDYGRLHYVYVYWLKAPAPKEFSNKALSRYNSLNPKFNKLKSILIKHNIDT